MPADTADYILSFILTLAGIHVQAGILFVVAENRIYPAPGGVTIQQTVVGQETAVEIVYGFLAAFRAVRHMVQPLPDNYDQDTFFSGFPGFLEPERAVFFIPVRVQELAVKRVVPFFELA
jgi:hypothetical protein